MSDEHDLLPDHVAAAQQWADSAKRQAEALLDVGSKQARKISGSRSRAGADTLSRSLDVGSTLLSSRQVLNDGLDYAIDVAQPSISRHLGQLREAGLVSDRREGLWIHYRIHPDLPEWVSGILNQTVLGVAGQQPYASDLARIAAMPGRPERVSCG